MNSLIKTVTLAGCIASSVTYANNTLYGGMVPGADLLYYVDGAELNKAPIVDKLEGLLPDEAKGEGKIMERLGLEEDDVIDTALSMDLDQVAAAFAQNPEQAMEMIDQIPAIATIGLRKAITIDNLTALGNDIQDMSGGELAAAKETIDGKEIFVLSVVKDEVTQTTGISRVLISLSDDGKTILAALNEEQLWAAKARITEQSLAKPNKEMVSLLKTLKGYPVRFALVLPDAARQQIQAMAQMQPELAMLQDLKGVLFSIKADEKVHIGFGASMGNAQSANNLAMMAKQALPGVGMMVPRTAPLAQNISVGTKDNLVLVNISLTEKDLKAFMEPPAAPMGGEWGAEGVIIEEDW